MPTKSELGLNVLYHGTPTEKVEKILADGLKPVNGVVWLAYYIEDARRSALDNPDWTGEVTVLAVSLPSDWELERLEADVFGSHKAIPPKYVKLLIKIG